MSWQFKIGVGALQTGKAAGVLDCSIDFESRAPDVAEIVTPRSVSIAYGTTVEIWYAGVRRFLGRTASPRSTRRGNASAYSYRIEGPWWWLKRIPYRQDWQVLDGDDLGPTPISRVILNQDSSGDSISVETQIYDIITYASTRGAPLQFGTAAVSLTLPFDEQRELTCVQAIERMLRFTPAVSSWIDYTTATPTIYFGTGAALTPPAKHEAIIDQQRVDLVVPGVEIQIERIGSKNDKQYRTLETLTAGNTAAVDALHGTLQLAGQESTRTVLRIEVETEDIPDPLEDAAWWIARHPRLAAIQAADLDFIDSGRWMRSAGAWVSATDLDDYPRVSLNPLPDLSAIAKTGRVEKFTAEVDIIQRNAAGEIIDATHAVPLEMELITTDAVTKVEPTPYRIFQTFSSIAAEPTPANLASELLAHWSVLYSDGSASWPLVLAWPLPGQTYAGSPIQTVSIESALNTASVTFGAPEHLSVNDFADRLQGFRTRRPSVSYGNRSTAEPPAESEINPNNAAPARATGAGAGQKRRSVLTSESGGSIDLDPDQIDPSDTMSPHPVSWQAPGGATLTAKMLTTTPLLPDGSEPGDPSERDCSKHPGDPSSAGGGSGTDEDAGQDATHPGDADPSPHPGDPSGADGQTNDHPGDAPDWCTR